MLNSLKFGGFESLKRNTLVRLILAFDLVLHLTRFGNHNFEIVRRGGFLFHEKHHPRVPRLRTRLGSPDQRPVWLARCDFERDYDPQKEIPTAVTLTESRPSAGIMENNELDYEIQPR